MRCTGLTESVLQARQLSIEEADLITKHFKTPVLDMQSESHKPKAIESMRGISRTVQRGTTPNRDFLATAPVVIDGALSVPR